MVSSLPRLWTKGGTFCQRHGKDLCRVGTLRRQLGHQTIPWFNTPPKEKQWNLKKSGVVWKRRFLLGNHQFQVFMLVFGGVHSCHSPRLDWVDSSLYHKEAVVICTGFLYGNMWEKVGARKNISLYNGQTQIFGTSWTMSTTWIPENRLEHGTQLNTHTIDIQCGIWYMDVGRPIKGTMLC